MQSSKRNISKKHITNEIYKTFEIFKKQKNISIADFLNKYESILFYDRNYRKIKFTYESLLKLILYQKLKGIKFQTKLVRYLKRSPKEKYRLGFSQTPNQTTISFFLNKILDKETKELIDFIAAKIEEISEKHGILFDVKTLQPEKVKTKTKDRNQRSQKNVKTKDVCKLFKRRITPFINLHMGKNTIYKKTSFIDLLIHMGLTQDFAENGSRIYKVHKDNCPNADTLLYHIKKSNNIRELKKTYETLFEIIWEMARRANIFDTRKRVDLAIDYTEWFYYGNKKTPMVVGKMPERGSSSCYKFATINIVENGKRFTLFAVPVSALDDKRKILSTLLLYAMKRVKINKVYLDRGFFNSISIQTLNDLGTTWIMPGQRNSVVKRAMDLAPTPSIIKDFPMKNVKFNLVVAERDGEKRVFATNMQLNENDPKLIERMFILYSKRWGIETSYRVKKHSYRPKTTSKNYIIRLFYFLFSVLLYNLWILADVLIWLYLHGSIGNYHLVTSKYFGTLLMSIDPGG
jgi:putative transposase